MIRRIDMHSQRYDRKVSRFSKFFGLDPHSFCVASELSHVSGYDDPYSNAACRMRAKDKEVTRLLLRSQRSNTLWREGMHNSPLVISFVNCLIVLRCVSELRLIILILFF